jgi:hypothetical protein
MAAEGVSDGLYGLFRTISDQAASAIGMGKGLGATARRGQKRGRSDEDSVLLDLETELLARICAELDLQSFAALQSACKHLSVEAGSNQVWRAVCARRRLQLAPKLDDAGVNWQHIFRSFIGMWALPRIRGIGWTFSSVGELNRAAESIGRMGARRQDAVTILRRRTPSAEFWHWWFVAVIRGSKSVKLEQGSGSYSAAGGAAAAVVAAAAPGSGNGSGGGGMMTRGLEVKREIRDSAKSKGRRVRVVLKSGGGAAAGGIELTRRHNTRAATSPPSAGTRSGISGPRSPGRGPRSPLRLPAAHPGVMRSPPSVVHVPKSPAKLPPRLPPRPNGPPAKPPTLARCSPFDYVTKKHLQMHVRALVAEASNSGVRVQQLRSLHASLMKHQKNPHELFNIPVDPVALLIPDYEKVIKQPMDLGLIKRQLEEGYYSTTSEYAYDVRLVFSNAQRFNPLGHWINGAAATVSQFFEEKLRRLESKCLTERQRQAGHSCGVCHGLTCRACGEGCLHFTPTPLRCAGPCGMLIRRGSIYFYNEKEDAEICQRCFRRLNVSVRGAAAAANRAMAEPNGSPTAAAARAAAELASETGSGTDDDDEEGESAMTQMREIDKSSVADRSRKKITFVKDPSAWVQDRWDPDWGEPEPWDQCACCLEVYHRGCGMHDPQLKDKGVYVCMFCRIKQADDPEDALALGPEPSPTEMGTLRVDHSRTLPKPKGGAGAARVRRRGQLVTSAATSNKDPTPYSVPAPESGTKLPFPMPQQVVTTTRYDAASLQGTDMGAFIETAIKDELRQLGEPEAADATVLRMVSSCTEVAKTNKHVRQGFAATKSGGYAAEYPFKSKALFLFQRLDGIDVLLFVMYVQEYDADCPPPNNRQVYISYLDSVQYFRPRRLRTSVYHTLIVSYLEYVRRRGFVGAHIWACPPLRSGSYIFCTRPIEQQVPTGQRLRAWYQQMLVVARDRGTCVGQTTMYDKYFEGMGDPNGTRKKAKKPQGKSGHRKSSGSHKAEPIQEFRWARGLPPYFEGDWWTLQGETVVKSSRWQQPRRVLRQLMEHPSNRQGLFNAAVDLSQVKDYMKVVKKPMDLGTIKAKLDRGGYKSPKDYADDVRLVFNNAMAYNHAGHWVHDMAKQLIAHFEARLDAPMMASRGGRSPRELPAASGGPTDSGSSSGGGGNGHDSDRGHKRQAIGSKGSKGWKGAKGAGAKGAKGAGGGGMQTMTRASSPRGVVSAPNPIGDPAPPPPDTPQDVWHSLLQNTATFLVGTRDEHIIAYLHWHCSACSEPVEGKAWAVRRPPKLEPERPTTSHAAHPPKPEIETVPPCMCLCAGCYAKHSSMFNAAGVPPCDVEEINVKLGNCEDPDGDRPVKPNAFVDVRNNFFEGCQEDNFNFDTLRRAKHSTMMVLHRLHGIHDKNRKLDDADAAGAAKPKTRGGGGGGGGGGSASSGGSSGGPDQS